MFLHNHFHELERNLLPLRFLWCMWSYPCEIVISNHYHKTRFMTNLNSYGLNLLILNFFPSGSTRAYECFQVIEQLTYTDQCTFTDQGALPYAIKWELIELTCIVNLTRLGIETRMCQHGRLSTLGRVLVITKRFILKTFQDQQDSHWLLDI